MNTSAQIAYFQGQIDPTQFGVVRNYLVAPRSPIQYLLHVAEPEMLPRLAAQLDGALNARVAPQAEVRKTIDPLLAEGTLKISSREPVQSALPGRVVDPASILRSTPCQVIYLPPFYLVHTPGLFEGQLRVQKSRSLAAELREPQAESREAEPARKQTKDHDMSH